MNFVFKFFRETCIQALANCISICGGFLPLQTREMIESVAVTCLEQVCLEGHGLNYCSNPTTKLSILSLGINCVSTPCQDGSASTIIGIMKQTSSFLRADRDFAVSSMAYTAVNLCNSLLTSHVPPLVIIKRDKNIEGFSDGMVSTFSKEGIEESIINVREIVARQKKESEIKRNKGKLENVPLKQHPSKINVDSKIEVVRMKVVTEPETQSIIQSDDVISSHQGSDVKCVDAAKPELKSDQEAEADNEDTLPETKVDRSDIEEYDDKGGPKEVLVNPAKRPSMLDDDDGEEASDLDEDFPIIVDCDPDEEDME